MDESEKSFLTDRQVEALRMRLEGRSLDEIAAVLNTTKQNVSTLIRRARENYQKALNTIAQYTLLTLSVKVEASEGMTIEDVVKALYRRADEVGIHVPYDKLDIASRIREQANEKLRHSLVISPFEVGITHDGDIVVF
ncbi:MAG: Tfx family DNA-binding protein [Methermicoccaceae archaeon]